jgi:cell division protein FtsB
MSRNKKFVSGQNKPKPKRIWVFSVVLIILAVTIIPRARTIWELSARKEQLEKEKIRLVQINTNYKRQLQALDSPEAMERIAREQLGMVKKGERVIMQVTREK